MLELEAPNDNFNCITNLRGVTSVEVNRGHPSGNGLARRTLVLLIVTNVTGCPVEVEHVAVVGGGAAAEGGNAAEGQAVAKRCCGLFVEDLPLPIGFVHLDSCIGG